MEVRIAVAGADAERELASLHRWIAEDGDAVRGARLSVVAPQQQGQMGAGLEAINAVVGNALALSSLVVAVLSWRDSRPTAPAIRIERDGTTVELTGAAADDDTVRRIIETLDATSAGADVAGPPDPT